MYNFFKNEKEKFFKIIGETRKNVKADETRALMKTP
jgi:hypothetical protein